MYKMLSFFVNNRDIENVGKHAVTIKKELKELGIDLITIRRISIICFEGEMNLVAYSICGGTVKVEIFPEKVMIILEDNGPGIDDLELAMTPGFSTAPDYLREYGFGAGMGLKNMKKNSDVFEINSSVPAGTRIVCEVRRQS